MHRRHLLALAIALVIPACAHPPITLPRPDLRPPSRIDQVHGYQSAVNAIAAVIERELGIPPFPVTFDFYLDDAVFEKALRELGHDPVTARETARVMRGVGIPGRVLVNSQVLEPMSWSDRVRVLAHELTHCLQYELAGGNRGASEQWLREGFAEWVALTVRPLTFRGRPFAFAIATLAASRIEYPLPPGVARFRATGAIDDRRKAAAAGGAVRFVVAPATPQTENTAPGVPIRVSLPELGFPGPVRVRDLWAHREIGTFRDEFATEVPFHVAGLYRLSAAR